ncbi:NADH-quinone oxidoreductase subunit I [Alicyclobacillus ferrooxydans]|uniref:NADH-quinone oxidoreductase subunit I n=1 Tax=Alicyclobacillus ferrooxydans TaxID=471514 RepID=UPI003CCBD3AE
MVKRLWKHGIGTIPKHEIQRVVGRGKLSFDVARCNACGDCALECSTEALSLRDTENGFLFSIAHGTCISCRVCTEVCPTGAFSIMNEPIPSVRQRDELVAHYTITGTQMEQKGEIQNDRNRREVVFKN